MTKINHERKSFKTLLFGLTVVSAGVILILFNMGVFIPLWKPIIFSWQTLLIVLGLFSVLGRNKHHIIWGLVLILIGGFFLIPKLIVSFPDAFVGWNPDFSRNFWPLLLVVLGLLIIFDAILKPRCRKNWTYSKFTNKFSGAKENIGSKFEKNAIFNGGQYIVLDPVFSGGELNAIFGGIELDLRKTELPEGDTFLEVNAIFGGIEITVPENWYILSEITSIFGGVDDKRNYRDDYTPERKLILTGGCVFGGCTIKN